MNTRKRQYGLSGLGVAFLLFILAVVVLLFLKLFPIYMESMKIKNAVQGVMSDPSLAKNKHDALNSLWKRFDIEGIRVINEGNYKDYITWSKKGDKTTMQVQYESETPLVANLRLVASFDITAASK